MLGEDMEKSPLKQCWQNVNLYSLCEKQTVKAIKINTIHSFGSVILVLGLYSMWKKNQTQTNKKLPQITTTKNNPLVYRNCGG